MTIFQATVSVLLEQSAIEVKQFSIAIFSLNYSRTRIGQSLLGTLCYKVLDKRETQKMNTLVFSLLAASAFQMVCAKKKNCFYIWRFPINPVSEMNYSWQHAAPVDDKEVHLTSTSTVAPSESQGAASKFELQKLIGIIESLSKYKDDPAYEKSISCFKEQLSATKWLLFKEPLEQLCDCKDDTCRTDIKNEIETTADDIAYQTGKCLADAKATGKLLEITSGLVEKAGTMLIASVEHLIDGVNVGDDEKIAQLLEKLDSISAYQSDYYSPLPTEQGTGNTQNPLAQFLNDLLDW